MPNRQFVTAGTPEFYRTLTPTFLAAGANDRATLIREMENRAAYCRTVPNSLLQPLAPLYGAMAELMRALDTAAPPTDAQEA